MMTKSKEKEDLISNSITIVLPIIISFIIAKAYSVENESVFETVLILMVSLNTLYNMYILNQML
jgi:hypothetical protein